MEVPRERYLSCGIHDAMKDALPGLAQFFCAIPAHIQILADHKAAVADQTLADGAVVHVFRRIPDGILPSLAELLLIDGIEDDSLVLVFRFHPGLGKTPGVVSVLGTAAGAEDPEEEHLSGG